MVQQDQYITTVVDLYYDRREEHRKRDSRRMRQIHTYLGGDLRPPFIASSFRGRGGRGEVARCQTTILYATKLYQKPIRVVGCPELAACWLPPHATCSSSRSVFVAAYRIRDTSRKSGVSHKRSGGRKRQLNKRRSKDDRRLTDWLVGWFVVGGGLACNVPAPLSRCINGIRAWQEKPGCTECRSLVPPILYWN